jgi:O-antigen ligase
MPGIVTSAGSARRTAPVIASLFGGDAAAIRGSTIPAPVALRRTLGFAAVPDPALPVPFAVASVVQAGAVLLAAAVAAAALLAPGARGRAAATVAAPLLAALALASTLQSSTYYRVGAHLAQAGAAAVAGLVAVGVLTVLFRRRPGALVVLAVAALPFRVPVAIGGTTANLLLPLYLVIAAGCLAHALPRLRAADTAPSAPRPRVVRRLELALAATVALYAAQSLYSTDVEQAAKNVCFFYVPFTLLYRLLLDVPWSARALRTSLAVTVGLALVFAAIGFFEFATGRLLLHNPKVLEANELKPYFRVNSLFFDPNIYGRFLALTMVLLAAVLLWTRRPRSAWAIGGALLALWAGLVLSLSQSSFAALLVGLATLAALRWRAWPVLGAGAVAALAATALVLFAPGVLHIEGGSSKALDKATSGRVELVDGAVAMFRDRPLQGFGSGAFQERYREREHVRSAKLAAVSHTTPLTIAAEQGIVGLAVYAWLLVASALILFGGPMTIARAAVAAAACALWLHTLVYASFLEDPLLWTLLAIGAALRLAAERPGAGESSDAAPARSEALGAAQ